MTRRWNLLPLAGFLLAVAAFLTYFLVFAYYPITRDFPWVNLLWFAFAIFLSGVGLMRAFTQSDRYRGKVSGPIFMALSLTILGFFLFYNFSLSQQLPASEGAPQVGQRTPDFTLPNQDGEPVKLSELYGRKNERWVLLVFYRGYW